MRRPEDANSRSNALDGLRGVAALSVLAFHVWLFSEAHTVMRRDGVDDLLFASFGLGLYLFFALSGYLLYGPFARAALQGRRGPDLPVYVRSRIARIAPAYYVCVGICVAWFLIEPSALGGHAPARDQLWLFGVFGQNFSDQTILTLNGPTWSLVVELGFYLLLPFVGWFAVRSGRAQHGLAAALAAPLVLAAIGVAWNAATIDGTAMTRLALPAMLPYFAAGMVAAVVSGRWKFSGRISALLALAGAALVACDVAVHEYYADLATVETLRNFLAAAGFAMILAALPGARRLAGALSARPLVALGTVSYGVYLWHVPVILFARAHGLLADSLPLALMTILAATIPLAALSWLFVERPALAWAKRRGAPAARPLPAAHRPARGKLQPSGQTA